MQLYGIKNCDTVKKARRWLDTHGIAHGYHDFRLDGLQADVLNRWVVAVGWEMLLNRRGTTWRQLPDEQKLVNGAADAIALMLKQPTLIKRPVVEDADGLLVGFDEQTYAARFLP